MGKRDISLYWFSDAVPYSTQFASCSNCYEINIFYVPLSPHPKWTCLNRHFFRYYKGYLNSLKDSIWTGIRNYSFPENQIGINHCKQEKESTIYYKIILVYIPNRFCWKTKWIILSSICEEKLGAAAKLSPDTMYV